MSTDPALIERIVKLEAKMERFDEIAEKVSDLHELMHQAKGARWAILGVVGIGGFLAGKLGALSSWIGVVK